MARALVLSSAVTSPDSIRRVKNGTTSRLRMVTRSCWTDLAMLARSPSVLARR
jgi:hypothetical protein